MIIAVCDRDIVCVRKIKQIIYQYANRRRIDVLVEGFSSGEQLLASGKKFSLVILEYNIKRLNGLETARLLRQKNPDCAIVFLSAYTDFVLDSFQVSPYRFLLKPLDEKKFISVLDDYLNTNTAERPMWIKDGDDTYCLKARDIFYLEAENKNCIIGLRNKKIRCHKTMARVYNELPKRYFCKINRAYVVNFNYIMYYNSENICLNNGQQLHVSRNYYKSFKNEYRSFAEPCEL